MLLCLAELSVHVSKPGSSHEVNIGITSEGCSCCRPVELFAAPAAYAQFSSLLQLTSARPGTLAKASSKGRLKSPGTLNTCVTPSSSSLSQYQVTHGKRQGPINMSLNKRGYQLTALVQCARCVLLLQWRARYPCRGGMTCQAAPVHALVAAGVQHSEYCAPSALELLWLPASGLGFPSPRPSHADYHVLPRTCSQDTRQQKGNPSCPGGPCR